MSGTSESVSETEKVLANIDAELKDIEDERWMNKEVESRRKQEMGRAMT